MLLTENFVFEEEISSETLKNVDVQVSRWKIESLSATSLRKFVNQNKDFQDTKMQNIMATKNSLCWTKKQTVEEKARA